MQNQPEPADFQYPAPAPIEFAGQWIAWNKERSRIVAHGTEMASVHREAVAAGFPDAILQRVRRPDANFIGAA